MFGRRMPNQHRPFRVIAGGSLRCRRHFPAEDPDTVMLAADTTT